FSRDWSSDVCSSDLDFGCSALLDAVYARGLPVFGVCLGLQAMVEHAGGTLELLPYPEHGKRGRIRREGESALLDGLPEEFVAAQLGRAPRRERADER